MKKPKYAPLKASIQEKHQISSLQKRIASECPDRGYAPPLNQKVSFRSLPLSDATLRGLEESGNDKGNRDKNNRKNAGNGKNKKNISNSKKQFLVMTDIQNACIPHALRGRDILGAARTGRLVLMPYCHMCLACAFPTVLVCTVMGCGTV